MKADLDLY